MPNTPRVLVSWSSGKDSAWMLYVLRRLAAYEVGALLTTTNERARRVAMHGVRVELLQEQALVSGLPLWELPLPHPCSNEVYEERLGQEVARAVREGFTHVAFGDLFLEDVRAYRESRLAGSGLAPLFPLWGRPTRELAGEMLNGGLKAKVTCVDPRLLPPSFASREFDETLLDELPAGVDPCGERGEFHTFAYDGPMFASGIRIQPGPVVEREGFVFADFLPA